MTNRNKTIILLTLGIIALNFALYKSYKSQERVDEVIHEYMRQMHIQDSLMNKVTVWSKADELYIEGDFENAYLAYEGLGKKYADLSELAQARMQKLDKWQISGNMQKSPESKEKTASQSNSSSKEQSALFSNKFNKNTTHVENESYNVWRDSLEKMKLEVEKLKVNTNGYLQFSSTKNDKISYVGQMKDGKANGKGVGMWSTGGKYEGEWSNNFRHGKGSYIWSDGDMYQGDYYMDKRQGNGKYIWKKGEYYIGGWHEDMRNGQGTLYDKKGKVKLTGMWENDTFKKK